MYLWRRLIVVGSNSGFVKSRIKSLFPFMSLEGSVLVLY